jgi:L-rhamnose mutarotase
MARLIPAMMRTNPDGSPVATPLAEMFHLP